MYTEFQCPSMPWSCQKVCGGAVRWVVVCKPILVFSFFQAEQYLYYLGISLQKVLYLQEWSRVWTGSNDSCTTNYHTSPGHGQEMWRGKLWTALVFLLIGWNQDPRRSETWRNSTNDSVHAGRSNKSEQLPLVQASVQKQDKPKWMQYPGHILPDP